MTDMPDMDTSPDPATQEARQHRIFTIHEKKMILRVFKCLSRDNKKDKDELVGMCAEYTGCSKATVYNILREENRHGHVREPKKSTGRKRKNNTLNKVQVTTAPLPVQVNVSTPAVLVTSQATVVTPETQRATVSTLQPTLITLSNLLCETSTSTLNLQPLIASSNGNVQPQQGANVITQSTPGTNNLSSFCTPIKAETGTINLSSLLSPNTMEPGTINLSTPLIPIKTETDNFALND